MEFKIPLLFLFTLVSTSQALKFFIGGNDGWTLNPSENYNQWAGRNRFQISDTIVFKYKKGSDSVLEVMKEDYEKCNKTMPIKKFEDGDTEFTLDRAGPFYFISGKDQNCEKGQKLTLVVISPRKTSSSPPSPSPSGGGGLSPSPKSSPPSSSPPAIPTPSPSVSPPSPVAIPPAGGPMASSPSPVVSTPPAGGPTASSPSPVVSTPPAGGPTASSPSPVVSTPPAGGPTASSPSPAGGPPAPSPTSTTPAGGPSPTSTTPAGGPPAPGPGAPSLGPMGAANSPGSSNSTAPSPNSGSSVAPSSFLVYSVTVVVGVLLLRY